MIRELPEKLRMARQRIGLSQKTVAKKLDVSPSIISGYETGERTPSAENLLALSYLYCCTTDYLLGREKLPQKTVVDVTGLNAKQVQLLSELIDTMRP